ncbi:MAG: riboflavin synthase [Vallitalea sp.]|jgi:riboflavin synthase|nr:riboflavin synthase [Vallitalea sp.]
MFTGLINEIGEVLNITKGIDSAKLTIKAKKILSDINIGDSIAVNGVCLTVINYEKNNFTVDVMPETMLITNMKNLKKNSLVNLESALKVGDRFGGHIVTGHIDGIGSIGSFKKDDNATRVKIKVPSELTNYIIYKGSVTVDGVSLTVSNINENGFEISIIPLTSLETIILRKKIGEIVNIECDIIGKYVERLINNKCDNKSKITKDYLRLNGFM